jgi:hypothetical protein
MLGTMITFFKSRRNCICLNKMWSYRSNSIASTQCNKFWPNKTAKNTLTTTKKIKKRQSPNQMRISNRAFLTSRKIWKPWLLAKSILRLSLLRKKKQNTTIRLKTLIARVKNNSIIKMMALNTVCWTIHQFCKTSVSTRERLKSQLNS